jgi:hypothetical protein
MLHVAIVGTFAASLEDAIRGNLTVPCEIVVSDERALRGPPSGRLPARCSMSGTVTPAWPARYRSLVRSLICRMC